MAFGETTQAGRFLIRVPSLVAQGRARPKAAHGLISLNQRRHASVVSVQPPVQTYPIARGDGTTFRRTGRVKASISGAQIAESPAGTLFVRACADR